MVWFITEWNRRADANRLKREQAAAYTVRANSKFIVATADFKTNYVDDNGKKTGISDKHWVSYIIDGNGSRSSKIEQTSGHEDNAKHHENLVESRFEWRIHNKLPTWAKIISKRVKSYNEDEEKNSFYCDIRESTDNPEMLVWLKLLGQNQPSVEFWDSPHPLAGMKPSVLFHDYETAVQFKKLFGNNIYTAEYPYAVSSTSVI